MQVKLSELKVGERGRIVCIEGDEGFRKRIAELGFVAGIPIESVRKAPFEDPGAYLVRGTNMSLRNSEASKIIVSMNEGDTDSVNSPIIRTSQPSSNGKKIFPSEKKDIKVALVGNPNCGKTSLFNFASKSREKVANYSGVTVSMKEASLERGGYRFQLVDLPGTYSLSSHSPEEEYVRDYLMNEDPDIIVNVVDATSLERNLYLTTQLIDMNLIVVVALNMFDEFQHKKDFLKYEQLGKMLGIPFIPTVAKKGKGIENLFKKIIQVIEHRDETVRQVNIPYSPEIEQAIVVLTEKIGLLKGLEESGGADRYTAIRLLEGDNKVINDIGTEEERRIVIEEVQSRIKYIDSLFTENTSDLITGDKYGFIEGALRETLVPRLGKRSDISRRIDNVLVHNLFSLPLFFGIILLVFYLTFSLGSYPVAWIESFFDMIGNGIAAVLPDGILKDLLIQGVIPGVGAIAVFLPNIIILFLFISFMEDTGYMARTAFIVDRIMHKAGLHGKSFIPLLIGFGCNVPAIMATRTIEDRRNRLVTMMIIPFISCSARLPIYVLFISAFFPSWKPLILFSLYMIGIILAWITAVVFGKLLFKKAQTPFVMELPPYRLPMPKAIIQHMWFKTWYFIKKMGGVILLASVIIWVLGYLPRGWDKSRSEVTELTISQQEIPTKDDKAAIREIHDIENSYISKIGKWIQPVFQPLGFDWKMSVSLITGLPAKEIIISTLGVLYQPGEGIKTKGTVFIQGDDHIFSDRSMLRAFSFMIFTLLYFPCIGTLAVLRKESGNIKWPLITLGYTTLVAWITSFLVFQVGSLLII
jgi:ferrous iron transport protein B